MSNPFANYDSWLMRGHNEYYADPTSGEREFEFVEKGRKIEVRYEWEQVVEEDVDVDDDDDGYRNRGYRSRGRIIKRTVLNVRVSRFLIDGDTNDEDLLDELLGGKGKGYDALLERCKEEEEGHH